MVRECVVRAGKIDFRYVASDAIPHGHHADLGCAGLGVGVMASPTFVIVSRSFCFHIAMRLVAGRATNTGIAGIVALADHQTVRLEPQVANVVRTVGGDLRPGAVTAAAKVGHFFGGEATTGRLRSQLGKMPNV
jgi:hypothetical protein